MTQERHQSYADYFEKDHPERAFEKPLATRFQESIQRLRTVLLTSHKSCDCPTIVAIKSCREKCDNNSRFKR